MKNRIKSLMVLNGMRYEDLAQMLGISSAAFSLKMRGTYQFKANELLQMSLIFKVPTDYILGKGDEK